MTARMVLTSAPAGFLKATRVNLVFRFFFRFHAAFPPSRLQKHTDVQKYMLVKSVKLIYLVPHSLIKYSSLLITFLLRKFFVQSAARRLDEHFFRYC